jgi:hypothetical protein
MFIMTNDKNNEEMFEININDAIAQCKTNPISEFDGKTPISVEYAKKHFTERANFHLNRLARAVKRPTPELYDENGNLSMDIERFQADINALLHVQKNRAAIETTMLTGEEIKVSVPHSSASTIFKKIDEKTLLINAE